MAWTDVAKPTGVSLTWNQATMQWFNALFPWSGNAVVYTDLAKPTTLAWTDLAKPSAGFTTIRAGMITGLMIPLTYAVNRTVGSGAWTDVAKPI